MKNALNLLSDELFLKIKYQYRLHKKLDLKNPKTFNEKLQWLKLNNHKKIYTTMVDKYEAKKYIADIIGERYIIPTLGVYDQFDNIDFDKLPNQFVIKCTHDSGGLVICKDKAKLDRRIAKRRINKSLKHNYYFSGREWPYKNVKPRILIEQYMEDPKTKELSDYKFFCFNGKIGIVLVCTNRQKNLEETWLDENFNYIDLEEGGHKNRTDLTKPACFEEMKRISRKISKGIPHIRVDLYEINGKVYFGELTFFPASGFERFSDESWNEKLGNMIDLGLVKQNEK